MKSIHITIGILLALGIIILGNIVIYEAVVRIFSFNHPTIIQIILGFLSFGFIAAVLIGIKYSNRVTRIFYLITSVWFGFSVYFFLASLTYLVIIILFGKEPRALGLAIILIPVFVGGYGVFRARDSKIKKVNIKLANMREEWIGKRAVWISDVHIGLIYQKRFIEKIVKQINALEPDIFFVGGDLFDGISTEKVINFADPLKEVRAPLGKFYVSGNHEQYGKSEDFYKKVKLLGMKILKNELLEIDGLQIIGLEYSKIAKGNSLRKIFTRLNINKNMPSILLKHEPSDLKATEEAGISFQISGHTHNAQQWPFNYYANAIYQKFTYGLNNHGSLLVYTSSGVGTWGPAIRVGSKSEIVQFTFSN